MSRAPAQPLLALRGIGKRFPGVIALDGVDFTVRAGEVHALMGENGAGKSTLIKVLTGVHRADGGTISRDGSPIAPASPREAEAAGISTVYQEVNLIPSLTVADNIALGRQPGRWGCINSRAMRERARTALARLELHCDVDAELGSLSVAHQQMVAIARALDIEARVLVLDEPTASLDEREVEELFRIMRRLRDEGMGIVFVTHFLDQVYAVTDRITVLRNGRFVGEYATSDLPRLELVGHMLGRKVSAHEHAPSDHVASDAPELLQAEALARPPVMGPVSLGARPGEVTGLAGLLGSGRTETVRMLFGIDPISTGSLTFDGESVTRLDPRETIRRGFAFCSEDRKTEGILPNLTVRENIIVALQARQGAARPLPRAEQDALCDRYIKALRIKTPDAEVPVGTLSGGNQQKVLIARWLATKPRVLILDEPTRGIDVGAKQEIENLIDELRAEGLAVIFISSEIEEIVRNCHRVFVLRDRRTVAEFSGADITLPDLLATMAGSPAA
ncbi:sugar ABC transporter ATP-binding protein [Synoicihabitans lomoniglobus]|uniref:Sugar ABC transporter ATP-binding protein n=1 Tax=Synoicihabitans lomoniglobus TaxID=2909285 RepID=A0AAF0CN16_9BACT|nr:sugar ABC transporter ATP-binding protein [Opitutaceae bacterium LMO-M01]WED64041.1 sugar ABC transporter ATP-binding protein [Opitutaceae bacterium LMO-M01]